MCTNWFVFLRRKSGVSYIVFCISAIATFLGFCEPFGKRMRTILIFNFIGNVLVGLSYLLTASYGGAAICSVACVQVVINYIFNSRNIAVPSKLVLVYAVVFSAVNLVTFSVWYDVFPLIAAILFVFSMVQSETKNYRILYALNSISWIFYDFVAQSYGNLATHIILFAATSIAMVVRERNSKKST